MLRAVGLSKTYPAPDGRGPGLQLFRDLDLEVAAGEMVAVVGRSGAGKSSLLHLLAGLDRPSSGEVWLRGKRISSLDPADAAAVRNRDLGFVWQFHYLLPEFSALENVALPLLARGTPSRNAMAAARVILDRVELGARTGHRSGELSGGEQQRVAMARALVTRPAILLADEPTGDLDDGTAAHLFALMQRLCREDGLGVVLVTHNLEIAHRCDRMLRLTEGKLQASSGELADADHP
ncbi:MAG TPA: ABC transporter ATP-binding protein [Acidobacteriaceae bacterium]|nr:ABC transporter ATP-binding protein [Acidobacteriaceae bacterium]